jgi:hypothetical protein
MCDEYLFLINVTKVKWLSNRLIQAREQDSGDINTPW